MLSVWHVYHYAGFYLLYPYAVLTQLYLYATSLPSHLYAVFMQPSLYAMGHVIVSLCHGSCYWVTALWVNRTVTMLWDSGGPKLSQNLRGAAQAACVL